MSKTTTLICTECLVELDEYTAHHDLMVCPQCDCFTLRDYAEYARERGQSAIESRYETDQAWEN